VDNDLKYTSKAADASENSVTIRYVVAGASTALSVSVAGKAITVNVATDAASAATSTATAVANAVAASAAANALVTVANADGNTGAGVVTALAVTSLSGGSSRQIGSGGAATGFVASRGNPTKARVFVG